MNGPLAEAARAPYFASDGRLDRRLDRSNQERTHYPYPFDGLTGEAIRWCLDVDRDVGQFRQDSIRKVGDFHQFLKERLPDLLPLLAGFNLPGTIVRVLRIGLHAERARQQRVVHR